MNGNKFVREVSETQSKYRLVKKNITQQSSYNLSVELENYLYEKGAIKKISFSDKENDDNIYYSLNDGYRIKFGPGLLNIIGNDYSTINPNVLLVHTTNNNKFQIRRNDHNVDQKELNWFRELYDKNVEGANFEISYDENNKIIYIDNKISPATLISKTETSSDVETNDYIEDFRNYYINNLQRFINEESRYIPFRHQFVEKYPIDGYKDMDIENYVSGDGKTGTLCYDLERGDLSLGGPGIGGQYASKFGIYVHEGKYVRKSNTDVIENIGEFWPQFRNQLYSLLKCYETLETPIHTVDKYPLLKNMSMVLTKLLHMYYPNKFVSICAKKKAILLFKYFGFDFDKNMGTEELSFILNNNLRNAIPEINDNDPRYLGASLWYYIQEVIESDEESEEIEEVVEYDDYDDKKFLEEVFMNQNEYNKLVKLLEHKKNLILKGSPGVGKTFMAKRLAYSMIGKKAKNQILSIQFHQSYSYEDFIEGIRPNDNGGFDKTDGIFKEFVNIAKKDRSNKYFVIIDEINRGNLSKILGELMMLIESDKRDVEEAKLPYTKESFVVPSNIYIIGTMNTADRSLAMVDYALRRRFAFYHVNPAFGSDEFANWLHNKNGISESNINDLCNKMISVNKSIDDDLGKGFEIGHSYFVDSLDKDNYLSSYKDIIDYEITPLLEEYWFDEDKKVEEYKNML